MRITAVNTLLVDRFLYVEVETDNGVKGIGESGAWGYLEASAGAVDVFRRYLIGQDPLRIEHHWQYLYRWTHFRGAAIMGALSAIDIALWDIAGKHFGVPVHQLLGGACRDRARAYYHVYGRSTEDLVRGCVQAKELGFTAVGHLQPFLDEPRDMPYYEPHAAKIENAVDRVRQFREAVGNDVDLCLELHRRLTPAEAVAFARGAERYTPFFIEDPTLPDSFDAMAEIADKIHVPIATGERLHTIYEFEIAEAHHAQVVPHNPLSPVSTAACIQIAASIPNFALQEFPLMEGTADAAHLPPGGEAVKAGIVETTHRVENGFIVISDAPGIGVELVEGAAERFPFAPRTPRTRLHVDGSVVDQ